MYGCTAWIAVGSECHTTQGLTRVAMWPWQTQYRVEAEVSPSPLGWQASLLSPDPPGLILQAQLSQALEELGVQKQRADTVSAEVGVTCCCKVRAACLVKAPWSPGSAHKGVPAFAWRDLAYRHLLLCGHGAWILETAEWKDRRRKLGLEAHPRVNPRCEPAGVLGVIWEAKGWAQRGQSKQHRVR